MFVKLNYFQKKKVRKEKERKKKEKRKKIYQGFFQPFWEGALGPFALGIFLYFIRNWENFFNHFYMNFLNSDPKTALNHSYSWLYALF